MIGISYGCWNKNWISDFNRSSNSNSITMDDTTASPLAGHNSWHSTLPAGASFCGFNLPKILRITMWNVTKRHYEMQTYLWNISLIYLVWIYIILVSIHFSQMWFFDPFLDPFFKAIAGKAGSWACVEGASLIRTPSLYSTCCKDSQGRCVFAKTNSILFLK